MAITATTRLSALPGSTTRKPCSRSPSITTTIRSAISSASSTAPSTAAGHGATLYREPSFLEPEKHSNRLSQTELQHDEKRGPERYLYDARGNIVQMPHLPVMQWDFLDRLAASARQVVNDGASETTFYQYDAAGQRARKVTERRDGRRRNERLYNGGFEIYREYDRDGDSTELERETLHVMDDKERIALVETLTREHGDSPHAPEPVQRYQLANHLGSATLELDEAARLISYEEYAPYGETVYQAGRHRAEVRRKRYRYTGKERDEENGFTYHGARYYAPWLGRWTSVDPDRQRYPDWSPFCYVLSNPLRLTDANGRQPEETLVNNILEHIRAVTELQEQLSQVQQELTQTETAIAYYSNLSNLPAEHVASNTFDGTLEILENKFTQLQQQGARLRISGQALNSDVANFQKAFGRGPRYSAGDPFRSAPGTTPATDLNTARNTADQITAEAEAGAQTAAKWRGGGSGPNDPGNGPEDPGDGPDDPGSGPGEPGGAEGGATGGAPPVGGGFWRGLKGFFRLGGKGLAVLSVATASNEGEALWASAGLLGAIGAFTPGVNIVLAAIGGIGLGIAAGRAIYHWWKGPQATAPVIDIPLPPEQVGPVTHVAHDDPPPPPRSTRNTSHPSGGPVPNSLRMRKDTPIRLHFSITKGYDPATGKSW